MITKTFILFILICQTFAFEGKFYQKTNNVSVYEVLDTFSNAKSKIECLSFCRNSPTFCEGISYENQNCELLKNVTMSHEIISQNIWIDPEILIESQWTTWTEWTDCTRTCENAIRTRTKHCSFNVRSDPCPGNPTDVKLCKGLPKCPIKSEVFKS